MSIKTEPVHRLQMTNWHLLHSCRFCPYVLVTKLGLSSIYVFLALKIWGCPLFSVLHLTKEMRLSSIYKINWDLLLFVNNFRLSSNLGPNILLYGYLVKIHWKILGYEILGRVTIDMLIFRCGPNSFCHN